MIGTAIVPERVAAIEARIAGLQARLAPGPSFSRALAAASVAAPPAAAAGAAPTASSVTPTAFLLPSSGAVATPAALPTAGLPWQSRIAAAADEAGVDPALLTALVWTESGFDPDAVSHAGAIGLTQLMPGTAAGLGVDPRDPEQNLRGGARYLRAQLDRFGSVDLALAAYNAGPGRVARAGGIPNITETRNYVERVTTRFAALGGTTGVAS